MAVASDITHCFIVMEYFESETLRCVLFHKDTKSLYNLTEANRNNIALQICQAKAFLHSSSPSIVHKDLKPENVLYNLYSQTKICDLGLSKFTEMPMELQTTIGHIFQGTLLYMAPEILIDNKPPN